MGMHDTTDVLTDDTIFNGAVTCRQYQNGYRFSIDAVLIAHFFTPIESSKIFDAGTGCGIIPLILMHRWGKRISLIDGMEIQPRLQQLANKNFQQNGFDKQCHAIEGDIVSVLTSRSPEMYDHTVCNPPYYKRGSGRQGQNSEARTARHQLHGTIFDFAKGCSAVLKNRGSAVFIYPAELTVELFKALAKVRLEIKRLQYVYSYPDNNEEAALVLVECIKNGGNGVKILSPFYIYKEKNGEYSTEMMRLYQLDHR